MYIGEIIKSDIANGVGVRLSIFVSGCTNHCRGCFQPETWDFNYGVLYTKIIEDDIISELSKSYYKGLSILGGDPFEYSNQKDLLPLVHRIKDEIPNKDIWAYTGYVYDKDLVKNGKRYYENITDNLLDKIDVLVDGPFILERKNIQLKFRGSTNQRIINLYATRQNNNKIILKEF